MEYISEKRHLEGEREARRAQRDPNRREFITNGLIGLAASAVIGASLYRSITYVINRDNLKPQDFEDTTWLPYNNPNGRIWTPYMNEKIPHNLTNWLAYQKEVSKKNKGKFEGYILLPDLDGSGEVGK